MSRSQQHLAWEGRSSSVGDRSIKIRTAAGTNLIPAIAELEGVFLKGTYVTLTVDTDVTTPTAFRYPAASTLTVPLTAAQVATALAALIDADAKIAASARDGVISIFGAGGAVVVTLTSPAIV